ncbi:hypothetical protein EIP86_009029 [Pleurotus ostreatoroseus]|nr:hypothetical protein EIP86_009029 [Pleurotus ostreatoroseus]
MATASICRRKLAAILVQRRSFAYFHPREANSRKRNPWFTKASGWVNRKPDLDDDRRMETRNTRDSLKDSSRIKGSTPAAGRKAFEEVPDNSAEIAALQRRLATKPSIYSPEPEDTEDASCCESDMLDETTISTLRSKVINVYFRQKHENEVLAVMQKHRDQAVSVRLPKPMHWQPRDDRELLTPRGKAIMAFRTVDDCVEFAKDVCGQYGAVRIQAYPAMPKELVQFQKRREEQPGEQS